MPTSHYVWTGPFGEVSVRLSLGVIRRLSFDAVEAFKSVPRRGLEIGGILLGRTDDAGGTSTITILDFAPVETEHREGPYFRLSPADLRNFDAALAEHRSDAVGLYRTHTRSQTLSFEDDDNDLLRRCFKQRPGMFLIVHPRGSVAAYGFPQIGPLAPVHEFPFKVASLASVSVTDPEPGYISIPSPASSPSPVPGPLPAPSPAPTPSLAAAASIAAASPAPASGPFSTPGPISNPGLASTRGANFSPGFLKRPSLPAVWQRPVAALRLPAHWREWFTPRTWAAISALAASVVVIQAVRRPAPRVLAPYPLAPVALSVERDGPQLRLHWQPDAPAVRAATHAVLYINDGKHQTKLNLAPKQLTSGLVPYRAESGEVLFRLDLFTPHGKTGDSIRVLGAAAPPKAEEVAPLVAAVAPPPAPAARTVAARRQSRQRTRPAEFEGNAMRAELPVQPSVSGSLAPAPEPVAFDPPPAVKPAEEFRLPEILSAPPVRALEAAVTVTAEPVTATSGFSRVVGRIPFVKKLRKQPQPFVPPAPIHEVSPNLSARDRHGLSRAVSVDVKVYVTDSGKVDYAELLSDGLGPDRNLATAAVFAARQWQFSPARLGPDSEPAEVVLHFRFAPGSGQ